MTTNIIMPKELTVIKDGKFNRTMTLNRIDKWIIKTFPDMQVGDFTLLESKYINQACTDFIRKAKGI